MPGRRPLIAASFLAFPGRGSYRRICRALFGSASKKSRPSGFPMDLTNLQALLKDQTAGSGSELTSHQLAFRLQVPVTATLRTDWGNQYLRDCFVSVDSRGLNLHLNGAIPLIFPGADSKGFSNWPSRALHLEERAGPFAGANSTNKKRGTGWPRVGQGISWIGE